MKRSKKRNRRTGAAYAAYVRAMEAVDENGIHATIVALVDVCTDMAEMVLAEYGDTKAATQWIRFSNDLDEALNWFEESQDKLHREMEG